VAHLTEGTLRRMYDDPDAKVGADALHLEQCAECQASFKAVSDDARAVATLLAVPDARVDTSRAFDRVRSAPQAQPKFGFRLPVARPGSRPLILAFAAVIAGIALLGVAVAQSGLVYTPSTVTPVPVTVADMQALSQLSEYGTITWTTKPQLQLVTDAEQAASASGLSVPKVTTKLPAGVSTTITYAVMSKAVAEFTFDANKATAAAAKNGKSLPAMPAGMDGAKLTVTVGPAVGLIYGELKQPTSSDVTQADLPQLVVGKSAVPTATSSSSKLTVKQMEDYLLKQPGISKELSNAIKAIGDPSTTLPIPVPVEYATSSKTKIQGVDAVALGDNTGLGSGVVWVKGGMVYVVAGSIKLADAKDIANNLK
jgi:hypothetical protein